MPMSNEPKQGISLNSIVLAVLWQLGCVLTLGYAPKYNRRVQTWQAHDTTENPTGTSSSNGHCSPNCTLPHPELIKKSSARAKQQKEWDRLMMPLSVITATSAAALAIPSPFGTPNVYWLATAFFSGALGLSLEGLIIVTYLTVFGASSSPKTIGRIAKGKRFLKGTTGPVAVITALPTAITTYSSLFLLAGLLAMTIEAGEGGTIQEHIRAFKAIVLVPVYLMLLCLIVTVAGCEFFAWKEKPTKESSDVERRGPGEDKASTESIASVGGAYSTGSGGTGPRRRTTAENVGVA